jgi:hypothetical protein
MGIYANEFMLSADQWSEDGYRYADGAVVAYTVDRKEQNRQLGRPRSPAEFLADPTVPADAKAWLRGLVGG